MVTVKKKPTNKAADWKVATAWVLITLNFIGFRVFERSVSAFVRWNHDTYVNTTALRRKYNTTQQKLIQVYDNTTVDKLLHPKRKHSDPPAALATIGYAVTITSCSNDKAPIPIVDAAAVLQHSIHLQSHRHNASNSRYDYRLYALVHPDASICGRLLGKFNYTVQILPNPVEVVDMLNDDLRSHVSSGCCGEKEFLKLYAFNLTDHPVVVHLDLDALVIRPLDDLIRVLLPEDDSEAPQAIFTRDYEMASNPKTTRQRLGVQGGFWMVQPNLQTYQDLVEIIFDGANFTVGYGWGGPALGHSWYYGVAQFQGLLSYYYGFVTPNNTAVEWDRCVVNAMADAPNTHICSSDPDENETDYDCNDCRTTPLDQVYTIHYTVCLKPWWCYSVEDNPLCLQFHYEWHRIRADREQRLIQSPLEEITEYKQILQTFPLQCRAKDHYRPMNLSLEEDSVWVESKDD